ncbi:MAG: hypothetical protein Fur0022_11110 [Anaerolineales bacterium]
MIVIHPYRSTWPAEFETIRADLQRVLGERAVRIDHIGSTSVPGLGAKDVIDIQITVYELSEDIRDDLVQAGFKDNSGFRDHVPRGEQEAPHLWEKFVFNQKPGERRANIHIRKLGYPNQRYALLFRDYLRAHPNATQSIELIKQQLARYHAEDVEAYYDIKDPVYDLIWEAAKEWAVFTGWKPD